MTIPDLPSSAIGLCRRLAQRHPEPEDAMQELLLRAWLNRRHAGPLLTTILQRRSADLWRSANGQMSRVRKRPAFVRLTVEPDSFDPEPWDYAGPEPELAKMLADGWRPVDIAESRGVGRPNISRRMNRIRRHLTNNRL